MSFTESKFYNCTVNKYSLTLMATTYNLTLTTTTFNLTLYTDWNKYITKKKYK